MAVRPRQRRGRGRHVLRSRALAAEIVRAAGIRPGDLVIDLGAGSGALTAPLVRAGARVHAVEIDTELAAGLRRRFPGLDVAEADALRFALPQEPFKVVANLPFDGATGILRRLLDPRSHLQTADVIVDWGLAAKRTAVWPGTQLSAYWEAWFQLSLVRRLTRSVFAPPPSVDAGLVRVVRRESPRVPASERRGYDAFLARGYKDGLRGVASPRCLKRCAAELGFERTARPRDLDAAQWAGLWQSVRRTV